MKTVLRYRSQLRFLMSQKPNPGIRIRSIKKLNFVFRPLRRFGVKPQLDLVS